LHQRIRLPHASCGVLAVSRPTTASVSASCTNTPTSSAASASAAAAARACASSQCKRAGRRSAARCQLKDANVGAPSHGAVRQPSSTMATTFSWGSIVSHERRRS
jgi:hypothetical protein